MDSKGIDTTILFTSSNLTNPALKEVDKAANVGKKFIIIYLKDLINLDCEPYELLKSKILKEMPSDD